MGRTRFTLGREPTPARGGGVSTGESPSGTRDLDQLRAASRAAIQVPTTKLARSISDSISPEMGAARPCGTATPIHQSLGSSIPEFDGPVQRFAGDGPQKFTIVTCRRIT